MFTLVGNYSQYSNQLLNEYSLPGNKCQHEWKQIKYHDLSTCMMKICHDACVQSGNEDLLASNPFVIVERHHKVLCKNGKVKNNFAPHTDREGPAGGPCTSILYYYQIDDGIDDVGLHFYEWKDREKEIINTDRAISTFIPKTGDVVTFGDNIPHCPGEFKTESTTPKIRGVFAIFIKHPSKKKTSNRCISWLPCFS